MEVSIRPVKIEDAEYIYEIRNMPGVFENILTMPGERISRTQDFIEGLSENNFNFVAEIQEDEMKKVVGTVGLQVNTRRLRHSGGIGIMVHKDYQGMGIGKALMEKVIDVADNWLMLKRLELGVYTDNERAIKLYKSCNFVIEGTKRYSVIRNGQYIDEYIMARYNEKI